MRRKPDDADEWYAQVPRSIAKHIIVGLALMGTAFGGFGVWAFGAPLSAAIISQGSFVATGQNKIIQHLEGGIISAILTSEGAKVVSGDPIVHLDETSALANERELYLRQVRLEAIEARLLAEYNGLSRLDFPDHLNEAMLDPEIALMLENQKLNFRTTRSALRNDVAILQGNADAQTIRARGYEMQLESHRAQMEILERELEIKRRLFTDGLIRRNEVSAAERLLIEAQGQTGRLEAQILEIEKNRSRYETEMEQASEQYRQVALEELQGIQAELDSIREQARKAKNVLNRAVVTSPVDGTVVRLFYHTAGGVIESGKPIAEIVPDDAELIVEVSIPRTEIDSVAVGQAASVRLIALNQRTTPVLNAEVNYVSADAIAAGGSDARDVYIARVAIGTEEMRRVPGFKPTPGMPAEVMIKGESRTFAQYLAKPIRDSMTRAFNEE